MTTRDDHKELMSKAHIQSIKPKRLNDAEVDDLKHQWFNDPCWDLAETEGAEGYREELRAFVADAEAHWSAKRQLKLARKRLVELEAETALQRELVEVLARWTVMACPL